MKIRNIVKIFTWPVGRPNTCSEEGNSKRNLLVSWLRLTLSINFNAYLVLGSTNVIFFFFFWSKKIFAATAVRMTNPKPTATGTI